MIVHQKPHQLRHGYGRVRVVQLERDLLREQVPVGLRVGEPAQHILHGGAEGRAEGRRRFEQPRERSLSLCVWSDE